MTFLPESAQALKRFHKYVERGVEICQRHAVKSPFAIFRAVSANSLFRNEFISLFAEIARMDGGKLSLSTVLGIIGLILGGVGIAAGGSAIGLPLIAILLPLGFIVGQEADSAKLTSWLVNKMTGGSNATVDPESESSPVDLEITQTLAIQTTEIVDLRRIATEQSSLLAVLRTELHDIRETSERQQLKLRSEMDDLRRKYRVLICVVCVGLLVLLVSVAYLLIR